MQRRRPARALDVGPVFNRDGPGVASQAVDATPEADRLRQRLRTSLRDALKARDAIAVAALRSAVSAIDNAEAVDQAQARGPRLGVGAGDVARRELSTRDVIEVVRAEATARLSAADEYDRLGKPEHATRLRAEAVVLQSLLEEA